MKKLPRHIDLGNETSHKGAVNFTSVTLNPKLKMLYGSLNQFMVCFSRTKEGEELLQVEVTKRISVLQEKHNQELEDAQHLGRVEVIDFVQEKFDLIALPLQEGTGMSKESYKKVRHLLSLESRELSYAIRRTYLV